jgi:hypothetical protein
MRNYREKEIKKIKVKQSINKAPSKIHWLPTSKVKDFKNKLRKRKQIRTKKRRKRMILFKQTISILRLGRIVWI